MVTKESYDHLNIRCPSLGGEVPFFYCRKQERGKPCSKLPGCWVERFDIETYIKTFFSQEEIINFFLQPHSGRLETILLNLEKAMNRQDEQKEKLINAIKEKALQGKISCADATRLADEHQYPRQEMGKLLNELKIKIKNCQLGCF